MQQLKFKRNLVRYTLEVLLAFLTLNAFAGGYYGLAGARGVPVEWLQGSPFSNYFIPSLFLILVVGGSALVAVIAVIKKSAFARSAALVCGIIVLLWIAVQVSIIGYVSWMQPFTAVIGLLILLFTLLLPKLNHPIKS